MTSETQNTEPLLVVNNADKGTKPVILICNVQPGCMDDISFLPSVKPAKIKKSKEEKTLIMAQKQIEKEQKQKARAELKAKKEAEKMAKANERRKKEEERRKQKEKDDQEKREKKERKETERKRKSLEMMEKQEAKRRKEMEKKDKEMFEEEKKRKEQNRFRGFFLQSPRMNEHSLGNSDNSIQQLNETVSLPRQPLNDVQCSEFDLTCSEQVCVKQFLEKYTSNYLSVCKMKRVRTYRSKRNSCRKKFKLLQFSENHRPPYWGTWRRRSKVIRPCAPFSQDKELLEYGVDSDEEWEEEEPGESLSDSEIEEEDPNSNEEDDDDGFFVPHGYLSADEGDMSDGEISEDNRQRKQLAKAKAWEAEFSKNCNRLIPLQVGIVQCSVTLTSDQSELLKRYVGVPLSTTPISLAREEIHFRSDSERVGNSFGRHQCPVPEAAMPDLIKMVHRNQMGLKKLVDMFREHWARVNPAKVASPNTKELSSPADVNVTHPSGISKRQLEQKICSIATKETRPGSNKAQWWVSGDVLKQYKLAEEDLVPLINEPRNSPVERKTPQGMKDIKQFFKASNTNTPVRKVVRSLSLTDPPPLKKRRVNLTTLSPGTVRSIDSDEDKENQGEGRDAIMATEKGIDWQKEILERNKIPVPIDIHF